LARAQRFIFRTIDGLSEWTIIENDDLPNAWPLQNDHPKSFVKAVSHQGIDGTIFLGAKTRLHIQLALWLLSANDLLLWLEEQISRYDYYQVRCELKTRRAYAGGKLRSSHMSLATSAKIAKLQFRRGRWTGIDNGLLVPALAEIFRANDRRFSNKDNSIM
jgi:hypothetical protein